jgi:glycine cleavage system aminomethyltransferase T
MIGFPDLSFTPATGDTLSVDGKPVGTITSADRGYFLGRSLALGYLPPAVVSAGAKVTVTAKAGGTQAEGEILVKAPYDPEMKRLKG